MFYHEYPPPPSLRPYIQCFWMLEHDYREPFHTHEHLWADTSVECIFSFGERYYRTAAPNISPRKHPLPENFLLGPLTKQLLLYSKGITGFIAARFHSGGLSAFTPYKATALVDSILPVAKVLPPQTTQLAKQLQTQTREKKLQLLTTHFESIRPAQPHPDLLKLLSISAALKSQHGKQKITDLTQQFDINPRTLERHFLQYIGLPAKLFVRILRFNHAKDLIQQNPDISLSALAYETGYADQAHFGKNFKQLFDLTPAGFRAQMKKFRADTAGRDHDVVFVQD
jgi:AraC-like DNA-binding protein